MDKADKILQASINELEPKHEKGKRGYEYYRRKFIGWGQAGQCVVNIYEIPVGKSAYPYHYHHMNEEVFYIISGQGLLRTPQGERTVLAGELLFFPAAPAGAHKLTNNGRQPLVYLDFDTANDLDVTVYPDSGKLGIWGKGINQVFREEGAVDYYEGE